MDPSQEQVILLAKNRVKLGYDLVELLEEYAKIDGVDRTQRKIMQDVKSLEKVLEDQTLRMHHIKSSNLAFYDFLFKVLVRFKENDITGIDQAFKTTTLVRPLRVDIVCDNGMKWIKAIARNAKTLAEIARGDTNFGVRTVLDQATDYVIAAEQNLCMFKRPQVIFYFNHEIENELVFELRDIGVGVASLATPHINEACAPNNSPTILNLDITTLLAYVSELCNGSTDCDFEEPLLRDQLAREIQTPLKPILNKLFDKKRLICCKTAHTAFMDILNKLGGEKEKARGQKLFEKIEVMADITEIPIKLRQIKVGGRINTRSLRIFGFGMRREAITVTANTAFVRSVQMQGVNVPVYTHQARALTEKKEKKKSSTELEYY